MSKRSRATKPEQLDRIQTAQQLRVLGGSPTEVVQALVRRYGINIRTAWRDFEKAKDAMRLSPEDCLDANALEMAKAQKLYAKNIDTNPQVAVQAIKLGIELRKEHTLYVKSQPKPAAAEDLPDFLRNALSNIDSPGDVTDPER